MKSNDKQGTFWVIDGLRIKKKQPFKVKEVTRQINTISKSHKEQTPLLKAQEPPVVDQRNFFTQKSYEDIADKRMDYGMIRFSSLSSVRGGQAYPMSFHQETVQNFLICWPPGIAWNSEKTCSSLYKNQFVRFEYNRTDFNITESLEEELLN